MFIHVLTQEESRSSVKNHPYWPIKDNCDHQLNKDLISKKYSEAIKINITLWKSFSSWAFHSLSSDQTIKYCISAMALYQTNIVASFRFLLSQLMYFFFLCNILDYIETCPYYYWREIRIVYVEAHPSWLVMDNCDYCLHKVPKPGIKPHSSRK